MASACLGVLQPHKNEHNPCVRVPSSLTQVKMVVAIAVVVVVTVVVTGQSQGDRLPLPLGFATRGAEVTTPFVGVVVRDARTLRLVLARLLAAREARQLAGRLLPVHFTRTRVAFGVGADLHPIVFLICRGFVCVRVCVCVCLCVCLRVCGVFVRA